MRIFCLPRVSAIVKHPLYEETLAKILSEEIPIREGARILGTSKENLWFHVTKFMNDKRIQEELDAKVIDNTPVEYTDVLKSLVKNLHSQVQSMMKVPIQDRPTSMIRELRGAITDLAALEGKLSTQPVIQLNQITMRFNKLTEYLFSNLCPECQGKVGEYVGVLIEDGQGPQSKEELVILR